MNIITRIKNNIEYAYYRKLREKAVIEACKNINNDSEFIKWVDIHRKCIEKCSIIPIK